MYLYSQTAAMAIGILACLAESGSAGSAEVAARRGISKALAARLLVQMAGFGLVEGTRGPNGGYRLTKPPGKTTLKEIVGSFDARNNGLRCPFGKNWCGNREPCPLHDDLARLRESGLRYLKSTTLAAFVGTTKGGRKSARARKP
jgi:Rrf2 family protein